ncbi:MAG TPA: hypothetical protein VH186_32170 [Chloroflexia bacterium]|nr:hypothetical protein [Chloroflexia bacterium]
MDLELVNRLYVTIFLILLASSIYFKKYLRHHIPLKTLHFSASTRYLIYFMAFGITVALTIGIAQATDSIFLLVVERILFLGHIYCFLNCVLTTVNPSAKTTKFNLARPTTLILLATLAGTQIICITLGLKRVEDLLSVQEISVKFNNGLLWFAGVSILSYTTICLIIALVVLLRHGLHERGHYKLWYRYRCVSLLVLTLTQFLVYPLDLAGHLLYPIDGLAPVAEDLTTVSAITNTWLIIPFALLLPFDRAFLRIYANFEQLSAKKEVQQLRWFHHLVYQKLAASYSYDPFVFFNNSNDSRELLDHVVISLNDLRSLLYRKVRQEFAADCNPVNVTFEQEVELWAFILAINISDQSDFPVLLNPEFGCKGSQKAENRNKLTLNAGYYIRIAKKLKKKCRKAKALSSPFESPDPDESYDSLSQ